MKRLVFIVLAPFIALSSYDVSKFYNFQVGTRWNYEFEATDSIIKDGLPVQDYYEKSKIEYILDGTSAIDSGKIFLFSGKDTVFRRTIDALGSGKVKDTTFVRFHTDTIAVAIHENFSYCLGKNHPGPYIHWPYFCPYMPLCSNISDTAGEFFTQNDTLYYSRKNDNSMQMFYTNYRKWSIFIGCTYSYTKNWYTDNFTVTTTKLLSFKEPITEIKAAYWQSSSAHYAKTNLFITPCNSNIVKVSSGCFIYHRGQMYNMSGKKICINPTAIQKRQGK